jgi:NADPH:quinone reductase-like Zn-dependent oxidoreductase
LAELLGSGRVVTVIDRVLPLADTAEAVRLLAAGGLRGKAVIDCR